MSQRPPRLAPLEPAAFTEEQRTLVGDWSHLNFARVAVRHPAAYRVFLPYIDKVIRETELTPRDREILVIRTLAHSEEVYEARHHDLIAHNAQMSDAELTAIRAEGEGLSEFDLALMRAADELVRDHDLSDATWEQLASRYTELQIMEVIFLVGCYAVMAMLTNSLGIPLESGKDTYRRLGELREYT